MSTDDALRAKPTLEGQLVVVRPLGLEHAEAFWQTLGDPRYDGAPARTPTFLATRSTRGSRTGPISWAGR